MPTGLNPLNATPEQLQANGLPPRPDQVKNPSGYRIWKRVVTAPAKRVMPWLSDAPVQHRPPAGAAKLSNAYFSDGNWSGEVLLAYGATSWGYSSFYQIVGSFDVPTVGQPLGACTAGWDWAAIWVGIDGWGTSDVLQAGVDLGASCSGGSTSAIYYPWVEWYPGPAIQISNMQVSPGNDMYVWVWNTSPYQGYAYIVNLSNNTAAALSITAPPGHSVVGYSAEWVVERPANANGQLYNLARYTQSYWANMWSENFYGTASYPGAPAANVGSWQFIMDDNSNYPVSYPVLQGASAMWVYDENSAQTSGSP